MENLLKKRYVNLFEGSYSFCRQCKKEENCCVRISPSGIIGNPILFKEDIKRIEKYTKIKQELFSINCSDSNLNIRMMKSTDKGCKFTRTGHCTIYPVRPLDCRLFPIDIKEKNNNQLIWIAYTAICPVSYNILECLEQAKVLLPFLKKNIREYARANAPWMHKEPFVELGPIEAYGSDN